MKQEDADIKIDIQSSSVTQIEFMSEKREEKENQGNKTWENKTPEEVDQYIAQPYSLETDPMSKDSFNTDKIRRENLNSNFANI